MKPAVFVFVFGFARSKKKTNKQTAIGVERNRAIFTQVWKVIRDRIGFVLLRSVIGPENSRHSLRQWDAKFEPISTWSPAFSRVLGSLVVFTLNSHWFFILLYTLLATTDPHRVIRHPEKPPLTIKNDWSIIQTNALNSMNLHKHYIPISLWATLRSPHRITGFLLSSSLRYFLKSLSQPWRYSSLNTNQSSFQLNVEEQIQINPSSQSEQRFISSLANENSKWTKWKNGNCLKCGKTRATKSRLFSALHLIDWEDGVSFRNQSQSKVQYLQSKLDHYRDSIKIPLML